MPIDDQVELTSLPIQSTFLYIKLYSCLVKEAHKTIDANTLPPHNAGSYAFLNNLTRSAFRFKYLFLFINLFAIKFMSLFIILTTRVDEQRGRS